MPSLPTPSGEPIAAITHVAALRHRLQRAGHAPLLALTLILAAAMTARSAGAQAADPAAESTFDSAMLAYEHNHWEQAFTLLARLADQGHPEARRMALQMLRHGPRLYGMTFEVASSRRLTWLEKPGQPLAQSPGARP
jgi:hypothetical protein